MSRPDPGTARFRKPSLLASFGAISLLVVIGIGLALGLLLQNAIRTRAITDAARTGEVAANVGVRPFLEVADLERDFVPLTDDRLATLDRSLGTSLSPNGIVRIKVWNRQHWLVYSDNINLRGRWFAGADTLERSFQGELTSEITDLSAPEEREERDFGELLAVYVPLRIGVDGTFSSEPDDPVIGAFEIYLPFQPIAAAIAADTYRLWATLAAGLAILYLALFRLVARASRRLRRQAEQNLYLATHDTLTGLVNRDAFLSAIVEAQAQTPDDGDDLVVLLDLDHFQRVNDTLGHHVGDELLDIIGERLASQSRPGDVVARLGGDEFGLLLRAVPAAHVDALLQRVVASIDQPIGLADVRLEVRASFGVAPIDGTSTANDLLQRADIAMYAAKADHSVVEHFRPEMDRLTTEALALAGEVRTGIEQDQFELHYQPKFDVETGRLVGCEALVRWTHPERGFVSPARFMPAVEQLPIGRDLSNHVVDKALADLVRWRGRGLGFGVSVNLSARDVSDPTMPAIIERLLDQHGVDGRLLTIELTESTLVTNEDRTVETLHRIRDLGCGVAIDDFGTGYASLSYLVRLPATELKIDQSFVRGLDDDEQSRTLVRHCVDIAHSLELKATAEGIETSDGLTAVRDMGCDIGQGYLMSKPLPLDRFLSFATDHEGLPSQRRRKHEVHT